MSPDREPRAPDPEKARRAPRTPAEAEQILRELAGALDPAAGNAIPPMAGVHVELPPSEGELTGLLYKTLLEQIPAVTFITSFENGRQTVYVSPQIESILGYSKDEWLADPSLWYDRLHPDEKERWNREFAATVVSRGTAVRAVYRFLHRGGRTVWILGDVRIRRDPIGQPLFVQAVGFDVTELEEAKARELADQKKRIDRLQSEVHREFGPDALVGSSEAMNKLRDLIRRVARSDASALITGESGTGKELVAHALHYSGRRKDKPFVAVNCASFTETLLDGELFGVEENKIGDVKGHRGKFEQAHGGTLFLDEIGEMSPSLQAKLLRVLQEKKFQRVMGERDITVDVRVIAATHRDLTALIKEGKFRADLYYRLNVVVLEVPPLRERAADIQELAQHFLSRGNREEKREVRISEAAIELMKSCSWSGNNVRELKHAIEGAVVICEGEVILPKDLPPAVAGRRPEAPAHARPAKFHPAVEELEQSMIVRALEQARGNKAEAARQLVINPNTLTTKMAYYGITALPEPPWVKVA